MIDLATPTSTVGPLRPGYSGANIRTWVGFKQFLALEEAAILGWFRARGLGPSQLFHEHGVGLELVDLSARLPAVLDVDDVVEGEVTRRGVDRFDVVLRTAGAAGPRTVLRGRARVLLVREAEGSVPAEIAEMVVDEADADAPSGAGPLSSLEVGDIAAVGWRERIPYTWCHFGHRMQQSGYVALLEATVDRFLADRGIGVARMLDERGWIPVVSRARLRILADAHMDEELLIGFRVTGVTKALTFAGRMDCWVHRDGHDVHVLSATITHGYAHSRGPEAGGIVTLDDETIAALTEG